MFETSLFATAALLEATLAVVDLQDAELRAEELGVSLTADQELELTEACDLFDGLIERYLEEGRSDILEDALDTLHAAERMSACGFLESAIENAATRKIDANGNLLEMRMMPLVVSRETADQALPPQLCKKLASIYEGHFEDRGYSKVTVSARLRTADEVYGLRFHEAYALNEAGGIGFQHLVNNSLQQYNDAVWQPVLRFLMVQTVVPDSAQDDTATDEPFTEPLGDDDVVGIAALKAQVERTQHLTRLLANELAVLYGSPLVGGSVCDVYEARKEGALIYSHKVAHISINRQLSAKGIRPEKLLVTCHTWGEVTPDSAVDQVRVALVGPDSELLAGHILECGNWFTLGNAMDLVSLICEWGRLDQINRLNELFELNSSEAGPYFCTGSNWEQLTPGAPRVEQLTLP